MSHGTKPFQARPGFEPACDVSDVWRVFLVGGDGLVDCFGEGAAGEDRLQDAVFGGFEVFVIDGVLVAVDDEGDGGGEFFGAFAHNGDLVFGLADEFAYLEQVIVDGIADG